MDIRVTMQGALRRQGAGGRPGGRRAGHGVAVGALTAVVAAGYSGFAVGLYGMFRTSSYDLVIFDQAVRSYAHFSPGISVIKGVHNGFGPQFSILGDHWSPVLASLAPLYWVVDSPVTLLVAQAVLLALAIPPLWVFTRRALGGAGGGEGGGHTPPLAAPWVVANTSQHQFSFTGIREQQQRVALLKSHGYKVVFASHGYVVLHRAGSPRTARSKESAG